LSSALALMLSHLYRRMFPSSVPMDRKAASPLLAEVLFSARQLTIEVRNMNTEATEIIQHWSRRLSLALDELDKTLERHDGKWRNF
jgi:hypothetical protein